MTQAPAPDRQDPHRIPTTNAAPGGEGPGTAEGGPQHRPEHWLSWPILPDPSRSRLTSNLMPARAALHQWAARPRGTRVRRTCIYTFLYSRKT
jgi:hypothetical protein